MRNLQTIISNIGIQSNCQGMTLIVRNEVVRSLRASLSTLRWYASRLSDKMRDARWHGLTAMALTAKQPAPCFATAKQHERHVRVIVRRSLG
ncbi:MAG: hypothetical protein SH868_11745 [Bythopirellula sp.]|nr:hypothetical protein [Bythopirellula sp.]